MPKNHLSYSGIIALITLVLAACSSSPEQRRATQVHQENQRIFGADHDKEIDLLELARQVVFLEQERQQLIFENRFLRAELQRRHLYATRYHLIPVRIAYFEAFAIEGDEVRFTSRDHEELPCMVFKTSGPYTNLDFNTFGLYYEEPCIYLPRGQYKVEVFNGDIKRFAISESIQVSDTPGPVKLVSRHGHELTLSPEITTIFLQ